MSYVRFATLLVAIFSLSAVAALADVTGVVRGTATLEGKPAAGIRVTIAGENSSQKTTTGADGAFIFPLVTYGHYTLTAHHDGYPDATTEVEVSSDSVSNVRLAITQLKEIGRARATTHGVSGTPVSSNALGKSQISVLPDNNSLNSLVQTVPGIVKFSYNEPVAHGFHGLTYEIDGAPFPQASTQDFSEVIDPKAIDSLEVMTGAFPAEYGGSRQGAVVNIVSSRINDFPGTSQGLVTIGGGSYGTLLAHLNESVKFGASQATLNLNSESSDRGLDSPTFVPVTDQNSLADAFFRFITPAGKNATLALDLSGQTALYQVPINPTFNPNDPVISPSNMLDVQREYENFANLVYTRTSKDGNGYTLIAPWYQTNRTVYAGDLPADIQQIFLDPDSSTCPQPPSSLPPVTQCYLAGLDQNRYASYVGLRIAQFRSGSRHNVKYGFDGNRQYFHSGQTVAQNPAALPPGGQPLTYNFVAQTGTQYGLYIQDKWTPMPSLSVNYGLRYDYSKGFVQGNQLSPRIGINYVLDSKNIFHGYFGRLYAAPFLEDTRETCVQIADCTTGTPSYDLKPEHDSYMELGLAHTFSPSVTGYFNGWWRNADNVLDTTNLFPTPIQAVFNNSVGRADGIELRFVGLLPTGDSLAFSGSVSESLAGGISGGTFLFAPDDISDTQLQPEDHDQTYTVNASYTHRFGTSKQYFATLSPIYGSGYPVEFESGTGRLPTHLTFDLIGGRNPGPHTLGFTVGATNLLGHAYLIKVANGFNTTQWAEGFRAYFKLSAPL